MKHKIKKLLAKRPRLRRKSQAPSSLAEVIQSIPRITNETVAEHREEVLSSARKYIYPLQHSKHRIVIISTIIFATLMVLFFVFCMLALYRFNSTSTFIYRVTQVIPFPVAKTGSHFVAYENYLFELRHYVHYYQTQQKVDFNGKSGKQQLAAFRKTALQTVVRDAHVKQLAEKHKVSISDRELNDQITLLRSQNRLGSNDAAFEDVLREFWGWSIADFKRELKGQMLAKKIISKLDVDAHNRAQNVLNQINNGGDFAELAKQYSDDIGTKANGGDYGRAIERTNRDLAPEVVNTLFKFQPGQVSGVIETPLGLEILKVREADGSTVRASHILFAFKEITTYTDPVKAKEKPHYFITP